MPHKPVDRRERLANTLFVVAFSLFAIVVIFGVPLLLLSGLLVRMD